MSVLAGFAASLSATVVWLVLAVLTGLRARRGLHLACVAAVVACLALSVVAAYRVGGEYDIRAAGAITPIHLWIARIATFLYVLPLATGLRTIFAPRMRPWHRKAAFLVLGATLLAAVTGAIMLARSPRIVP